MHSSAACSDEEQQVNASKATSIHFLFEWLIACSLHDNIGKLSEWMSEICSQSCCVST